MTLVEPERRLAPAFAHDLARHRERVALMSASGPVTYAELDEQVRKVAARLGVERRLVLIAGSNTVEALVAYLAALRGGHPALLAPAGAPGGVQALVDAYDPDVVISATSGWEAEERRAVSVHSLHADLALLMSTSGSTGSPKLVRLSGQNLHTNAAAIATYLDLTPADRAITTLPMEHCYGLSVINSHLHAGASLVLTDLSVVDRCFWSLFETAGATSFAGVPYTFDLLDRIDFASMSLPTLRYVTQAGGRMHADKVRRYAELGASEGWDLFVMYGQTEATARMAYLPPALAASHAHTIGVPIPGGSLAIDAPDQHGIGELVYRGPNVMLGYADRDADLALGSTVDVLHTGDLARLTADGLYEVVGRRGRFVKPYGLRIDLDRVEAHLFGHGITSVCTGDDELLVIAVDGDADPDTVSRLVADHVGLPRTHVCVVAGVVPRMANGKPDYAELHRRAVDGRVAGDSGPSTSADHRAGVRAAFAEVLGVDPTDGDTFVSLGGDSLSYVEMSIRLEAILGALPRDWHTRAIADLAPVRRARRFVATTDTTAVLRAVAIVLVVATHAKLWHLPGGAHALLAVAGYNFARFQVGVVARFISIARIAVPSMCWIAGVAVVSAKYGWPNALLVNGFVERPGDLWGYWFIEALVHILIPLAAVLAIPPVGRLDRRRPLAIPLIAVAAGLLVRFDVVDLTNTFRTSRPHEVFWLFALGWCAARATSRRQRTLVSVLAAAAVTGFFGEPHRELMVLAGVWLITWVPAVPMPRLAPRLVAPVASASLYVYLTHWQVYPPLARLHGPAAAVVGSVLVGIATWWVARKLMDHGERAVRRLFVQ